MLLNKKQRRVLLISCIVLVASVLFTPWDKKQLITNSETVRLSTGYYLVFDLPNSEDNWITQYELNVPLLATTLFTIVGGCLALLFMLAEAKRRIDNSDESVAADQADAVEFEIFKMRMRVHWDDILVGIPYRGATIDKVSRGTYLFLKNWETCGEQRPEWSEIQKALESLHIHLEDRPLPEELTLAQRMLMNYWLDYLRRLEIIR